MKIQILAAALPPALDGIGDYTALMASEMAQTASVKVLTAQANPAAVPGVVIETAFSVCTPVSVWNIVECIAAETPDWVLLQYNPFSYGRWGLNLHLPLVMRQIKLRCPAVRIAVMVHETFVPFGVHWKFDVMTLWQRPQFAHLCRTADVLFFSADVWAQTFRRKLPGKTVVHLPVGSNIPHVPLSRLEARARLGIPADVFVLGVFGTKHLSRRMDWIREAALAVCASGQEALVLSIGPDGEAMRALLGPLPLMAGGPVKAEEVSRRFAAMDIHLAPFTDGASTRRGSLMTGLQHGIATVSTLGVHTDDRLRNENGKALVLAEASALNQFINHTLRLAADPALREQLGREGRRLYAQEFTWASLADRLLSTLTAFTHDKNAEHL